MTRSTADQQHVEVDTEQLRDPRVLSSEVTIGGIRHVLINDQRTSQEQAAHLREVLHLPAPRLSS